MAERFDLHFEKAKTWPNERRRLREILLDMGLSEELKWRKPCYTYDGGNIAIMFAMKNTCGLGFFKGALLDDPTGMLVVPGENSHAARQVRFTSVAEINAREEALRAILQSGIEVQKAGLSVDYAERPKEVWAEELVEKMESDRAFKEAFQALTPGRQRGYNLFFTGAKQSKTRAGRIEKYAARIMDGLGIHDR